MAKSRPKRKPEGKLIESTRSWSPIIRPRCGGPIVEGQTIGPLFSSKLVKWDTHPVLSKPPTIHGMIAVDGSGSRHDLTVHEQLIQRAAMGGPAERAALARFDELFAEMIANALVAQLRKEAAAHGVDVWTWLASQAAEEQSQ
jgi:hypothetical protein